VSSAMPASAMPWLAKMCWSYLRFWPSFLCCGLSSQGLSFLQRVLSVELIRCAGVVVSEREVGCVMRFDGEGDADQLRDQGIEAGGFGVDAGEFGAGDFLQPGVELGFG